MGRDPITLLNILQCTDSTHNKELSDPNVEVETVYYHGMTRNNFFNTACTQVFLLGNALAPVPTFQVLPSYFFPSLVLMYFYRSSSLILTDYSNVFNVYLFVCRHSFCMHFCKLFCCSVHIYLNFINGITIYFILYLFAFRWFLRSIHGTIGTSNPWLLCCIINLSVHLPHFAYPLSQ